MAFGLTMPKWYNTYVLQIFFKNIFSKNCKNIFDQIFTKKIWKIFLTKYLQKIFAIPKCYTILESWGQMPSHGFDNGMQKRFFSAGG